MNPPKGLKQNVLLAIVATVATLLLLEAGLRVVLAYRLGPSLLVYGTVLARRSTDGTAEHSPVLAQIQQRNLRGDDEQFHDVRRHENNLGNYSKYVPREEKRTYDADTGEVYSVTINDRGFRGADFSDDKTPGVIRVITLGASSTFGYHNRDDMTYPAQLESILNARSACTAHFEVINLAIPHLDSTQILALFEAEGLGLDPDIVTFYEGFNDAAWQEKSDGQPRQRRGPSPQKRLFRWGREHLLLVAMIDSLVDQFGKTYTEADVEKHSEGKSERLLGNLERLRDLCAEHGTDLFVITQQARSYLVMREDLDQIPFSEEVELVRRKLADTGSVTSNERNMLTHAKLVSDTRTWAKRTGVSLIDGLAVLDANRHVMVSWVHLSHEGNRLLATAIADRIAGWICPDRGGN
jgi:hypothetical protein